MEHERKRSDSFFLHVSSGKTFFAIILTCIVFVILWQRYIIMEEHKNDQYLLPAQTPAPLLNANATPELIKNLTTDSANTSAPSSNQIRTLLKNSASSDKTPKQQVSPDVIRNLMSHP